MNRTSKVYKSVESCWQEVLNGRILAIDPSTGSQASMPGFAQFYQGKLEESGTIEVNPRDLRNQKLYSISKSLREEFEAPDVLVIENIPPVQFNRSSKLNSWSITAIQRSIGAIICNFPCSYIEVAPAAWQKYKPDNYKKTDEWDAICLGLCVLGIANDIKKQTESSIPAEAKE